MTHQNVSGTGNSQGSMTGCLEVDCDNTPETCGVGCGRHLNEIPHKHKGEDETKDRDPLEPLPDGTASAIRNRE